MSRLPLSVKRTLVTCSNPSCERYGHPGDKAPHKCASCKSARYCDRSCQRRHWRQHKEYCKVWAESSANNGGQTTVAQLRLNMAYLIWLLRGIPEYVKCMFEEYDYWKKGIKRGFIEFKFYYWEHLFNAIKVIEALPIYDEMPFAAMPGTPSYAPPGTKQSLQLRKILPESCVSLHEAVQDYMRFTENKTRPNLQHALNVAKQNNDLLVISVSVVLEGTYSTHIYDFLYRSLSWQPSDKGPLAAVPVPAK